MIYLLAVWLFASLCSATVHGCKAVKTIPDKAFENLCQQVKSAPIGGNQKELIVENFVADTSLGFDGNQTQILLSLFLFGNSKDRIVQVLAPYILNLDCSQMANIIRIQQLSTFQLTALASLVNFINDLQYNNQTIIDAFTFVSDKRVARGLIANAKPVSCIWGDVSFRNNLIFMIDTSDSMTTQMVGPNNVTMTRLEFVVSQLASVLKFSMQTNQTFNIIAYSSMVSAWQPQTVPFDQMAGSQALSFAQSLMAGGGENLFDALQVAFQDPLADGIVLVTDSYPACCESDILNATKIWNNGGERVLNTVYVESGSPMPNKATQLFLQALAAG